MPKRIIYMNQGNLEIAIPSASALKNKRTLEQIASKAIKQAGLPEDTEYKIIETSSLPSDRTFRNAWEKIGAGIEVNMPIARSIHFEKIKLSCDMELGKTDKELMLAIEREEPLADLRIKRQGLRDIADNIDLDSASTPEELKSIWPEGLKRSQN